MDCVFDLLVAQAEVVFDKEEQVNRAELKINPGAVFQKFVHR